MLVVTWMVGTVAASEFLDWMQSKLPETVVGLNIALVVISVHAQAWQTQCFSGPAIKPSCCFVLIQRGLEGNSGAVAARCCSQH